MSRPGSSCIVDYARIEAIIRKVFQEFESARHQSPSLTPNLRGGISEAKQFQLAFSNELKQEYYTQHKMLAEHDAPVQIVLLDVGSQSKVTEGPMSSLEIEICVLPGDFGSGYHQDWSSEQFNAKIIVQTRKGRPSELLKGNTRITLKDGVALIPGLEFTDISKWVRTGKFILAARSKEANVREAISEPFTVKDKRGMPIRKHPRPSLDSEIWRLRHIARDKKYHKQLSDDGIETVKDFLRLHTTNPRSLKEKFGNITTNRWEAILENAKACVIDDNVHYVYQATKRGLCLVLNSIYEVVKVSFDRGQTYRSPDPETFTSAEKNSVEAAKEEAYQNVDCFKQEDLEALPATPQVGMPPEGGAPQQVDLPATQQGQGFDEALPRDGELLPSCPASYPYQGFGDALQQVDLPAGQQGQGFDGALPHDGELLCSSPTPYPYQGGRGARQQVDLPAAQQGQGFDRALPRDSELLLSCPALHPYQGSGGALQQVDLPATQQGQAFDWALPHDGELLLSRPAPYPYQGSGGAPQQVDLPATQQGQGFDWALPRDDELSSCPTLYPYQGSRGAPQQVDLLVAQQGQGFDGALPHDGELLRSYPAPYLYQGFGGAPQQVDLSTIQQGPGFDGALPSDSELLHSYPNHGSGGAPQHVNLPTTQQGQCADGALPDDNGLLHTCLSPYLYDGSPFNWLY